MIDAQPIEEEPQGWQGLKKLDSFVWKKPARGTPHPKKSKRGNCSLLQTYFYGGRIMQNIGFFLHVFCSNCLTVDFRKRDLLPEEPNLKLVIVF